MERKKNRIILIMAFLLVSFSGSADDKEDIYSAYVTNRMELWKKVIDRMEASLPENNEFILELINYQYGYIGFCLGFNKEKEAREYLDLAEKNVERLEKTGYKIPVLNAYRSAFYGFRISLNKLSAPFNGPKSLNYAQKAIELDSRNWLGYIQYGNAHFYMPAAFGGSKRVAFENFDRARKLMESQPELTTKNWNYLNLLVTIAQSHSYLGEYTQARTVYETIMKIEPGFTYVRDELYPQLLKKIKT